MLGGAGRLLNRAGARLVPALRAAADGALHPTATVVRAGNTATSIGADGVRVEHTANTARWNSATIAGLPTAPRLNVEEQRVNSLRGVRAEGASTATYAPSANASAALPTHWLSINRGSGLSLDVSPASHLGMNGVRLRYYGTTGGVSSPETVEFDARNVIAAAAGQAWSGHFRYHLVAGSWPTGATLAHRILSFNGSTLVDNFPVNQTAPNATVQRATSTATMSAGVTWVISGCHVSFPHSTAVDCTFEVFWPQLEQGPFPTSVALPPVGAPAAATRNVDQVSIPLGDWFARRSVTNHWTNSTDATSLGLLSGVTVANDTATAPHGSGSLADTISETTANSGHYAERSVPVAGNQEVCWSVWLKANGRNTVWLHTYSHDYSSSLRIAIENLNTTPTVTAATNSGTAPAPPVATITPAQNGWWRVAIGGVVTTQTNASVRPRLAFISGSTTYAGDGSSGVFAADFQMETGTSTPSPFVAATASATTQSVTGPGTIVARFAWPVPPPTTVLFPRVWSVSIPGGPSEITLHARGGGAPVLSAAALVGAINNSVNMPGVFTAGQVVTAAVAWDFASIAACRDGEPVVTTSATLPGALDRLAVGDRATGLRTMNGEVEFVRYFNRRLRDSELRRLSAAT